MLLVNIPGANAEGRLALLIGNRAYPQAVGSLKNTHKDIALMKAALLRIGFADADIQIVADAGRIAMLTAFDTFTAKVRRAGPDAISFFYYTGHGASNDRRENFIIPVDIGEVTPDVWYRSVSLRDLLDRLSTEAPEAKHFVVFDACRNTLKLRDKGKRALIQPRGFEPVRNIPGGMLIAFSTAEGELASDIGEHAGPYATALAQEIVKPGVEAVTMFRKVQLGVSARTNQTPWMQYSPIGETYFAGQDAEQPQPPLSEAAQAWLSIQSTTSEAVLETFIRRFGDSVQGDFARARLGELRQMQKVAVAIVETTATAAVDPRRADKPLSQSELAALAPGDSFRECPGCPEMVVAPKGDFIMGSPEDEAGRDENEDDTPGEGGNPVPVSIGRAFAVGKFEVTFDNWEACARGGGCKSNKTPDNNGWGSGTRPVINVSWKDAQEYVGWLNAKAGTDAYRLLTEAEWEYAARSGEQTAYSWGTEIGKGNANCNGCGGQWDGKETAAVASLSESEGAYTTQSSEQAANSWGAEIGKSTASCDGCGGQGDSKQTAPVGSFKPSQWGLYDMHGNVWEWVRDCYAGSYTKTPRDGKPFNTSSGCIRVARGGSWIDHPRFLRSALRYRVDPDLRLSILGLRVARTLSP